MTLIQMRLQKKIQLNLMTYMLRGEKTAKPAFGKIM